MKNKIILLGFFLFILFWIISMWKYIDSFDVKYVWETQLWDVNKYGFISDNLKTDTSKKSIDLNLILNGWPWKDWIPAINNPKFIKHSQVNTQLGLNNETLWILVIDWEEQKFYPYSILYWHEIINDIIGDKYISVTFCPLCGTAIVYNRNIDWEILEFWVSWKLYESNLLMYDSKNESLWSQSIWTVVVWHKLWKKLEVIKSDVITYGNFNDNYPNWLILNEDTWYSRDYSRTPYGNYETDESLYFPVQNTDDTLHIKELMFILNYNWDSYSFVRSKLINQWSIEYKIWEKILNITVENWEITAKIEDEIIPGYIEMWFSWFTQHPGNDNVWFGEE